MNGAASTGGGRKVARARAIRTFLAWLLVAFFLLPFAHMVWTAQKPRERVDPAYEYLTRRLPGPEARQKIEIGQRPLRVASLNSLLVSAVCAAAGTLVSLLAGYAFAKKQFPGKAALFDLVLASMAVPPVVLMMPLFRLTVSLGIYDSLLALILPFCASGFGIFYMRYAISALPDSVLESARLDGLSDWGCLFRVVVPALRGSVLTLVALLFIANWNSFVLPHALVASQENYTLGVLLGRMMSDFGSLMWNDVMAVVIVAIVPVALLYFLFSRRVLAGLAAIGDERNT